jgi:hypothetical protein
VHHPQSRAAVSPKPPAERCTPVIGVRWDGQKMLLAMKSLGGVALRLGATCSTISSSAVCGLNCSSSRWHGGKKPDRRLHPVPESHFFLFDQDQYSRAKSL